MAQLGAGRVERQSPVTVARDDPFTFVCQGCGAYCCTNERLVLSPLEVRWLVTTLGIDLADLNARGWLVAYADPDSGIPRVAVQFLPVAPKLTACPFLGLEDPAASGPLAGSPTDRLDMLDRRQRGTTAALRASVGDGGRALPLRCQAYDGRPIMCRSFPLQFKLDLRRDGMASGWSMLAHTRCPGHGMGGAEQTVGRYVDASGVPALAEARVAWHELNLTIVKAGVTLPDRETASASRRGLWDATLNLLFASYARPALQTPNDQYIPTILALFARHLAPIGAYADAELRAKAGELSRSEAAAQLRALVAGCQALERALDEARPGMAAVSWPAPTG